MADSLVRWAMRSAPTAVAMFTPMPIAPIAIHAATSVRPFAEQGCMRRGVGAGEQADDVAEQQRVEKL